jgi:hypothetical protein
MCSAERAALWCALQSRAIENKLDGGLQARPCLPLLPHGIARQEARADLFQPLNPPSPIFRRS